MKASAGTEVRLKFNLPVVSAIALWRREDFKYLDVRFTFDEVVDKQLSFKLVPDGSVTRNFNIFRLLFGIRL